jgi:hypothetical protein
VCVCVCRQRDKDDVQVEFFQMDEAKRERDHLRAAMANTEDDSDRKKNNKNGEKMMYI